VSSAPEPLHPAGGAADRLERVYRSDTWRARALGVPAARGRAMVSFRGIGPPWLKEAAKAWARQRLVLGYAFNTVLAAARAFGRFSEFVGTCETPVEAPGQLSRSVVEGYLAWLANLPLSEGTKALSRVFLRALLEDNRRYRWAPEVPLDAVVYHDEVRTRRKLVPRFLPDEVIAQLESEANLARLRAEFRHLVVLLAETGLRSGDALALPFDPLVDDSSGWPCLRFQAHKVRAEQVVPLSERAVGAVRAQQRMVEEAFPEGCQWLFPSRWDPDVPLAYDTFRRAFADWQRLIGLHDRSGRPVHAVPHQLRHSLGTKLINNGVPQPVVQRLLGHASPLMTDVYAHLLDSTLREQLQHYWETRVDVQGRLFGFDPASPTADAEWLKHNLARVADSLPNGYCGRPPQQDCPHPSACLTCPDFQTTVQFLPVHRRQAEETAKLIEAAESYGHERLAANHRRVLANLEKIISALDGIERDEPAGA
jgi:integrase